jgi:hypothetical protein
MPNANQFQPVDSYDLAATITSGQSASAAVDLSGNVLCGLFMPASLTGTSFTLQASTSLTGTYQTVQKDEAGGGDYTITYTANKYVPLTNLAITAALRFIKLVSSSSEGADRSILLAVRPV